MALSPLCAHLALLGCIVINLEESSLGSVKGAFSVLLVVEYVYQINAIGSSNSCCVIRLFPDVWDCLSSG